MKRFLLPFIFLMPFTAITFAQCPTDFIYYFSTQDEVNNFSTLYPNCTDFQSQIIIQGDDIINLDGLANLESIRILRLINSPSLSNLDGLNNLIAADFISIYGCNSLVDLTGLSNLISLDLLWIEMNNSLINLNGLEGLTSLPEGLVLLNNQGLESLDGLNNLSFLGLCLRLWNNDNFTDLSALTNVTTLTGYLDLRYNNSITSLYGLDNVEFINFDFLRIQENPLLYTCDVESVCNYLSFPNNNSTVFGNSAGCSSTMEIESFCTPLTSCSVTAGNGWIGNFCNTSRFFDIEISGFNGQSLIEWNFGDGTIIFGGLEQTHTYQDEGEYQVCATVSNMTCSDTYCQNIPISNPPPVFDTQPVALSLEANDPDACTNDEYIPNLTATDPCVNNVPTPVLITYCRNDGEDISAPWQEGTTTVTAKATGSGGATSEISWNVEVLECEMICGEASSETFSTYFESNSSNPENISISQDVLAASNGEYITIGYDFTSANSKLIFQRQDIDGNTIASFLEYTTEPALQYSPGFSSRNTLIRDAFIEEAYDANNNSIGYYIATSVLYNSGIEPTFDALLMLVDHVGNEIWTEHANIPSTNETVRGLTFMPNGVPALVLDQSSGGNHHLGIWIQGTAAIVEFPLDDLNTGEVEFYPTCVTTINSNLLNAYFAIGGQWKIDGEEFIGVYLLTGGLVSVGTIVYDLITNTNQESVSPTSISSSDFSITIHGYHSIIQDEPASFGISFAPVNVFGGPLTNNTLWAKEYYYPTGSFFTDGITLTDSKVDEEGNHVSTGVFIANEETDAPFLMKTNRLGELEFINAYLENPVTGDFGRTPPLGGLDFTSDNGCFVHSTFFSEEAGKASLWTAKLDEFGGLDNCDCLEEISVLVQDLNPQTSISLYGESSFLQFPPIYPVTEPDVIDLSFSSCSPLDIDEFCGEPTCAVDTLLLNTGYDPINNTLNPIGSFDNEWTLTTAPTFGVNLPIPASVINPNSAWGSQENTNWISAYPYSSLYANNLEPALPYTFQNCFCTCGDTTEVTIDLSVYADDQAQINLVDENGILIQNLINHSILGAFRGIPGTSNTLHRLPQGTYCLSAELRNTGNVAMGININGYVSGASVVDAACCSSGNGTIVGTKFRDRNCSGTRDNPNNPNQANHEEGLEGWEISLCDANNVVLETTVTDPFGFYVFNEVLPGNYTVKETQQLNWEATNAISSTGYQISIENNEIVNGIDFANKYNGPVEILTNFDCVVPGEAVAIQWDGPDCDCDISISLISCGSVSVTQLIETIPSNEGGYTWVVPDDLLFDSYQIFLEACNGSESISSECFEVNEFELNGDAINTGCGGEVLFSANSNGQAQYTWDFGDGYSGEGFSVSHTYDILETYEVNVTAVSINGCSQSEIIVVTPSEDQTAPRCLDEEIIIITGDLNIGGAMVDFDAPFAVDDCSANLSTVCNPASGSFFPCGSTEVVCTITDEAGNSEECLKIVEVVCDTPCTAEFSWTNPSCHGGQLFIVSEDFELADSVIWTFGEYVSEGATLADPLAIFTFLEPGIYPVCALVFDDSCSVEVCEDIIIEDLPAPEIRNCPSSSTRYVDAESCEKVTYFVMDLYDPCAPDDGLLELNPIDEIPGFNIIWTRSDNRPITDPYEVGTTTIRVQVFGSTGYDECEWTNTVLDSIPPVFLDCPSDIVAEPNLGDSLAAIFIPLPEVMDNCPEVTVDCDFSSQQTWPCGETVATCIATDASGNADTCTFLVVVSCEDTICQSPSFLKLYGDDINNLTTKIDQHDNSLFALGYRTTSDPNVSATFTKLNLDGSIVWNVQLPSSYRMYDFIKSQDGFILVGGRRPFGSSANSLICKIDLAGNLAWSKEYNFGGRESLTKILPASDPNQPVTEFYALGILLENGDDQILLKIDEDGTELSYKRLDYTDDQLQSGFLQLSNGDYVMMGSTGNSAQLGRITADGSAAFYASDGTNGHKLFDGVAVNGKVYLVGQTAASGYLLVLNSTGTEKIARYTLPDTRAAYRIQADDNGSLYVSVTSNDPATLDMPLVYRLTESFLTGTSTDLSIEWVKTIENNDSPLGFANITVTEDQKLVYADNRFDAPGGFGDYDVMMGVFDLNMGGLCLLDTFTHSISEPQLISENINAAFTVTDQPFPSFTSFILHTEFEYLCAPLDCQPVACDSAPCQEFIEFTNCEDVFVIETGFGECEAFFDCSNIIAIDTCTGEEVITECLRLDGMSLNDPYPVGETTVSTSASNSAGLLTACRFTVSVVDIFPPELINCPMDTTICDSGNENNYFFSFPVFADNCTVESELTIICTHQPGDLFPVGTTPVTCTATDLYGNISEPCVFEITVEECPANCCEDIGGFNERFDQGFTVSNDGCNLYILPAGLEDCDIVTVDWGDDFSDTVEGSELLSHNYGSNLSSEYTITYQVLMLEEDGSVCIAKDSVFTVCIECSDCENPLLAKVWTKSIGDYDRDILSGSTTSGNAYNFMGMATNGTDIFVSGNFLNTANFGNGFTLTSNGRADLFFAKIDASGNIVEAFSAGDTLRELATEIELDGNGNIYVGGSFESATLTLPSNSGVNEITLQNSNPGIDDIFIAKYDASFNLLWANNFGNSRGETIWDMSVSSSGEIAICGRYFNLPLDFGNGIILPPGNQNAGYVVKFNTDGTALWAIELNSDASEDINGQVEVTALDFDQDGNLYVASAFGGEVDINPLGSSILVDNCSQNANCKHGLIAKYDGSNGHLNWHQIIGNESEANIVVPHSISVYEDKIYLTGDMLSPSGIINFAADGQSPIDVALGSVSNNYFNGFLAKYDGTAGNCDWAHGFNTNGRTLGVEVDNNGNPAIVGGFFSAGIGTDFDPDPDSTFILSSASLDGYVAKFNAEGEFITAFNLHGTSIDGEGLHEVVFDNQNNIITIGFHGSTDLDDDPSTDNTDFLNAGEIEDIFIGKYACSCSPAEGNCCEDPSSFIVAADLPELDACCFALNIQNDFGVTMTSLELHLNTDGWNIDQSIIAENYQIISASDELISITHSSGIIPGGSQEGVISFCLNTLDEEAPLEQQLEVIWMSPAYPTDSLGQMYCNDLHPVSSTCNDSPCIDFMSLAEPTCIEGTINEYEFNFTITNRGPVDASAIVLNSQHPDFTMINCNSPLNSSYANITLPLPGNLAPGATSENICISIVSAEPISEITELCLTASLEGTGTELCCIETTPYCLTIEPCCSSCESGSIVSEQMLTDTTGCCHQLDIINECYPEFFTRLELEILTEDVQFSNLQNGDPENWNFSLPDNTNTIVNWNPNDGFMPVGNYEDLISFCLGGVEVEAETQQVLLSWYIIDPNSPSQEEIVFCSETIDYECEVFDDLNCATVWYDSITCDTTTGIYDLTFSVENTSNPEFDMELVQLIWSQEIAFVAPNPIVISSTSPDFEQLQPGEIGQYSVQIIPNNFPFPESSFEFELLFKDDFGVACCNKFEHLSVPLPSCTDSNSGSIGIGITVFPNPFSDRFTILFERPLLENFQLRLFDIYGRELISRNIEAGNTEFTLEAKDLSAGIYFLELVNTKGYRYVEKLISH